MDESVPLLRAQEAGGVASSTAQALEEARTEIASTLAKLEALLAKAGPLPGTGNTQSFLSHLVESTVARALLPWLCGLAGSWFLCFEGGVRGQGA